MTSVGSSNVSPLDNPQVVDDDGLQVTCFTEDLNDVSFHFQIIGIKKQNNTVSVSSILGGTSDNTGSSIARRLVLKTGLSVILACNIPKNSPMLEANAERVNREADRSWVHNIKISRIDPNMVEGFFCKLT